jgi:hypothetical protein
VADKAEVLALADELRGKRTGVRYSDLARVLTRADCLLVGSSGSHRTWHHPNVRSHLTLIDRSGDVLPVYIKMTRKYLETIAQTL